MLNDPPPERRPHPLEHKPTPPAAPPTEDLPPSTEPEATPQRRTHPLEQRPVLRRPTAQQASGQQAQLHIPSVKPYVTYVLVAINVGLFVIGFILPRLGDDLFLWGALFPQQTILDKEYYRLFTAMFLHGSPAHILFNGYVLYSFGSQLERLVGHTRFGLIYLLGGLGGSVLRVLLGGADAVPSLGASGAIFAILGAYYIFLHQHNKLLGPGGKAIRQNLLFLGLLNLALGFFTNMSGAAVQIDNLAHVGGLLGGLVLAWFINPIYVLKRHPDYADDRHFQAVDINPLNRRYWIVSLYVAGLMAGLIAANFIFSG